MRILVVEDDRESASWLIKGLTEAGHVADHARDGAEGVALARERVHDVVVMDRMLPRSEEHTSELQSLAVISYAVFCLKKKKTKSHFVFLVINLQKKKKKQ